MTGTTARTIDPDYYLAPYQPYPWQRGPWWDKSPVVLLTGSAGGGKSRCAAEKINAYMLKYPGATGLMLRKAREFAGKSIVPFMRQTVQAYDARIQMIKYESHFKYANGSVLYWGGMKDDAQREAIRSIGGAGGLEFVWLEEANAFSEADFNELLARLRGTAAPWRQILLTTNPDAPTHWIYKRLIEGGQAQVYYSSAKDNPANPPDYLDALEMLTGVLYQRLVLGRWVHAEGAIYPDFDPATHLLDWFEPPKEWRRIRSIDFGYTNPFVCQWWAIDGDGRMYLYRETYHSQRLVEDHARDIIRLTGEEHIENSVSDHDAEDRATLERYGVHTKPAQKDISPGIQAVQQRLRRAGDGKPRLYLMRGALVEDDESLGRRPRSTVEEFPGYVWEPVKDERPVKETPFKLNDHGMDAMRYAVMYVDNPITVEGGRLNLFG